MRVLSPVSLFGFRCRVGGRLCLYCLLAVSILLVVCASSETGLAETCAVRDASTCGDEHASRGNSLLQLNSKPVRTHVDTSADDVGEQAEKPSRATLRTKVQALLEEASVVHKEKEESSRSFLQKWAAALLLVRTVGSQQIGRLAVVAASASGYTMVSIAALMCVVVLTAYLFLRAPGNLLEKEYNVDFSSPHSTAAMPRAGAFWSRLDSRPVSQARPGTSAQPPLASSRSLSFDQGPGLAKPYSAGNSPYSVGVSPRHNPQSPQPASSRPAEPQPKSPPTTSLCPGLVVPEYSECVLAIPIVGNTQSPSNSNSPLISHLVQQQLSSDSNSSAEQKMNVLDLSGKPVMKANIVGPWPMDSAFKQRSPLVMLSTMNPTTFLQEEKLAFCRAGGDGGTRRSMYIYDKDDVLFGCIKRDVTRPRYVLTSSRGNLQVLFEGNFAKHMVDVVSDSRDMMAHAEPCNMPQARNGSYYQVRVAAGVDVGLIVSGLLSIDAMETM